MACHGRDPNADIWQFLASVCLPGSLFDPPRSIHEVPRCSCTVHLAYVWLYAQYMYAVFMI